ncbi:MAG TPA: crossover junction endodeoxyribonuclease RuvC [Patescibacteria group bacterium]|nr:crossover junction endodeoxyribonuclease RuvC [Patescibacteria group bacterium]
MVILGVDPGIGRTGWGVILKNGNNTKPLEYGCIETAAGLPIETRLLEIKKELVAIVKKHKPEAMGIEELFFNTNAKTALIVGQARGAIIVTAAELGLEIFSYTPLQVKTAIAGYGRAEKAQMGRMVKMLLGLSEIPKPDDTADALAIALACAYSVKYSKQTS